jgi:NAD(P)H-dependent FMN reductase
MKILALSGSLRAGSSNTRVLLALRRLAPPDVEVTLYPGVGDLPHFNPDVESAGPPPVVEALRALVAGADALVISCPEYAHGVPGSFKNALDWLVGVGLVDKPVALINTSPTSTHAQASLTEILITMSATMVAEASLNLSIIGTRSDDAGIAADPAFAGPLRASLAALAAAARAGRW